MLKYKKTLIISLILSVVSMLLLAIWFNQERNSLVTVSEPVVDGQNEDLQPEHAALPEVATSSAEASVTSSTVEEEKAPAPLAEAVALAAKPVLQPQAEDTTVEDTPKEVVVVETFSESAMLSAHNVVRSTHSISPLTWSDTLAASAKTWADTLATQGCKMQHDLNTPYGENLYWSWSSNGDGTKTINSPAAVVNSWAAEESDYSYKNNTCVQGKQCGHYTQIVWANTTSVGCAIRSCTTNGGQTDIWVCRYSPAGNYIGEKPY